MAEFVTCKYLQFIELVANNQVNCPNIEDHSLISEEKGRGRSEKPDDRLQHLLFEVFKRILNYAKAQQAQSQENNTTRYLKGSPQPLPNIELPVPLA